MAVAEAYPAAQGLGEFPDAAEADLANLEDQIQLARRYYNGAVRDYNVMVQQFPSNMVAGQTGFKTATFFEIEDAKDRAVPKVSFS